MVKVSSNRLDLHRIALAQRSRKKQPRKYGRILYFGDGFAYFLRHSAYHFYRSLIWHFFILFPLLPPDLSNVHNQVRKVLLILGIVAPIRILSLIWMHARRFSKSMHSHSVCVPWKIYYREYMHRIWGKYASRIHAGVMIVNGIDNLFFFPLIEHLFSQQCEEKHVCVCDFNLFV